MNDLMLLLENFLALFLESAPWLLLGLLVAAVMHELVPVSLLQRHMGSNSVSAISKAAVIGAPLPLCSCGVIPAAVGLRRSGASKPATVSFLVSTPETGVDSVSVSYALLGPLYAIVRPVAAIFSALYAGIMVKLFTREDGPAAQPTPTDAEVQASCHSEMAKAEAASQQVSSCCSETSAPAKKSCGSEPAANTQTQASCCGSQEQKHSHEAAAKPGKIAAMWKFASGQLLEDIAVWLLVGLALAAAIQTWVPTDFLTQWGDGLMAMLVMAFIGVPMYICATASTPIAVGFLAAGLSPGAVLVFLLAGPATNVSTMGMIMQEMGKRTLALYVFSVTSAAIGLGYLLNWAVDTFGWQSLIITAGGEHQHGGTTEAIYALCAVILGALMIRIGWQKLSARLSSGQAASGSCCS